MFDKLLRAGLLGDPGGGGIFFLTTFLGFHFGGGFE